MWCTIREPHGWSRGGVLLENLMDGVEGGVLLENLMDGVGVVYY